MPLSKTITVDDFKKNTELSLYIRLSYPLSFRLWLGFALIKLGAWVLPLNTEVNLEEL